MKNIERVRSKVIYSPIKTVQLHTILIKLNLNPASGIGGGNQRVSLKKDFYHKCIEDIKQF